MSGFARHDVGTEGTTRPGPRERGRAFASPRRPIMGGTARLRRSYHCHDSRLPATNFPWSIRRMKRTVHHGAGLAAAFLAVVRDVVRSASAPAGRGGAHPRRHDLRHVGRRSRHPRQQPLQVSAGQRGIFRNQPRQLLPLRGGDGARPRQGRAARALHRADRWRTDGPDDRGRHRLLRRQEGPRLPAWSRVCPCDRSRGWTSSRWWWWPIAASSASP